MSTIIKAPLARVLIIYGLGVAAAMCVSEAVTELGKIAAEFHPPSRSTIGWVMSMPSLIVALGALISGYFVDRIGDRRVLFTGVLVMIAGDLLTTAAPSLGWLLAARAVTGLGYVLAAVAAVTTLIRMTSGQQRSMALALWSTFVPMSFLLPFLSAGLADRFGTWRAAFGFHVALLIVLLVLAVLAIPARDPGIRSDRARGAGRVLRSPMVYLLGISFAGDSFLQTGVLATLGHYLGAKYGIEEVAVAHWSAVSMISNALACLSVGLMLRRGVSSRAITTLGMAITGIAGVALYGTAPGFMASIVTVWVLMFGSGLLVGMWTLVPFTAPSSDSIGATSGLVTQITLLGVLLGPPAFFAAQAAVTAAPQLLVFLSALALCALRYPVCRLADRAPARHATETIGSLAESSH
ncbi:MFS transporter [Paracoccus litorisediminis]|uniref:MFS transporter n=1 Tax=Paracoccus litorisediminis TaxID=2006130 RepID=A0A844HN74_9RHOB|nr:MFS transporter [Paracoccus litorisediminis]MTH61360.1 MFS transporter [Paracoccus litorisediminis]